MDEAMDDGVAPRFLVISQNKTGTTTLGQVLPTTLPPGAYIAKFHDHRLRPVDPATMTPKKYAFRQHDLGVLDGIRALDARTGRLVVVTATRDPVARIYSHFFEKRVYPSSTLRGTVEADWTADGFLAAFRPLFHETLPALLRGELSFLQEVLNDGLAQEFPNLGFRGLAENLTRSGSYARYHSGAVIGLVLPSEDLLPALRAALADLGIAAVAVPDVMANAAKDRGFSRLYRAFMDGVPFPDRLLDLAYRSPLPRVLRSPAEIDALREGWIARWQTSA